MLYALCFISTALCFIFSALLPPLYFSDLPLIYYRFIMDRFIFLRFMHYLHRFTLYLFRFINTALFQWFTPDLLPLYVLRFMLYLYTLFKWFN